MQRGVTPNSHRNHSSNVISVSQLVPSQLHADHTRYPGILGDWHVTRFSHYTLNAYSMGQSDKEIPHLVTSLCD